MTATNWLSISAVTGTGGGGWFPWAWAGRHSGAGFMSPLVAGLRVRA
jgi:hypothetical protein